MFYKAPTQLIAITAGTTIIHKLMEVPSQIQ